MMNFDHAFIITYGRSGSTLLQGILNSADGVEIRGENGNILFLIYNIFRSLSLCKRQTGADLPTHPWFGASLIPHDKLHDEMISLFKRDIMPPHKDNSLTGFKEIRYMLPYDQLMGYINYVRQFFPRSAIIFNVRDLSAVVASNQKAKHAVTENGLRDADGNFRRIAAENPDFCHLVDYDHYIDDPNYLSTLFDFLGLPFDVDQISETLALTHSTRSIDLPE